MTEDRLFIPLEEHNDIVDNAKVMGFLWGGLVISIMGVLAYFVSGFK